MQHHLQETQEHLSRGQTHLKTTLTAIELGQKQLIASVDAGQEKIAQLLMQIVHGKEPPNYGGNNGATGYTTRMINREQLRKTYCGSCDK